MDTVKVSRNDPAHYKPRKVQITLRVDSDVIAWFRENHPRYQTLMNAVLRKEMTQATEEELREKRGGTLSGSSGV